MGAPGGPVPDGLFEAFVAHPARAGLFTDFDGTLAPIVDDPTRSRPVPGASDVLDRLAAHLGVVGVVSGRPVSVLASHFSSSITLSGLYGLQRVVDGRRDDHPDALRWASVVDEVVARAIADGPVGTRVEHKELSVTLHYRERPELADAVQAWAAAEAARSGLELHPARMSVELHPPVAADKGTAVLDLADGLGAVCFMGDDVGDLPAFAALDVLAARGVATVKVAVHSLEQDPRLIDAADVTVDGPEAVLALLVALLERVEGAPR
jgi:trehalose 6-phosphate phosphatase